MLLILTVLVVVHEWGHYISARIFGVKVNEFSIFMGPKIYSRVGKKTGVVFSIRCLPLGGFCAMEGEETTEDSDTAFCNKPWWQRTIILLSGVFMNFILALVIVTVIFMIYGYDTREVSYTNDFMPAAIMGIEPGDKIIEYNGYDVLNPIDYNLVNYAVKENENTFVVRKSDGKEIEYKLVKSIDNTNKNASIEIFTINEKSENKIGSYIATWDTDYLHIINQTTELLNTRYKFFKDENGSYLCEKSVCEANNYISTENIYTSDEVKSILASYSPEKIGFSFSKENGNIFESIGNAAVYNVSMVKSVFNSIKWMITGRLDLDAMSGPIGLTTVVDDVVTAEASIWARIVSLLDMAALISANLAAFNVLPIPGLDGGRLMFLIIEAIKGKPVKHEAYINMAGMLLLMLFALYILFKDIITLF
jgi:regulator of sigma E protease